MRSSSSRVEASSTSHSQRGGPAPLPPPRTPPVSELRVGSPRRARCERPSAAPPERVAANLAQSVRSCTAPIRRWSRCGPSTTR
eukprot:5992365-Prymnesium_polylepis.2